MPNPIKNDRMSVDQLTNIMVPLIKSEIRRSDGVFADKIASISGLELTTDGKLRIDIGQNPSLLAIDPLGLVTQYITATGTGANVGVKALATGTAKVELVSSATGQVRLEVGSALTTLILTPTAAQFGSGATTYVIDSISGLLGQIDSDGGASFRIEDTGSLSGGLVMSATETRLAGFTVSGIDGSPVTIQPQDSFISSPLLHVHGGTGVDIQGGSVHIEGGDTTGTAVNTDGGPTIIAGGIPTGTGKSRVKVRTKTTAGAFLDLISCYQASGTRFLSFYGATEVAQQAVDIGIAAVHTALVNLGLITSTGVTTAVSGVPTGMCLPYAVGSTPPSGYLLCDGSAVSRTTYATLFAAIGATYGAGDGSTTFNVPDHRGRFVLGVAAAGTGSALAATGGAIDHTHDVNIASTASGVDTDVGGRTTLVVGAPNVALFAHIHNTDPANTTSTTNNPPFIAEYWMIKT